MQDLKPGVPFLPKVLEITSYIGACLSIVCLLLVLIIYLSSRSVIIIHNMHCSTFSVTIIIAHNIPFHTRDLRSTEHKQGHQGQLVINVSFALLGLYIVFILSDHVTSVRPFCGLSAALLQFFILAYFAWTAVEGLLLLIKVVLPFHMFGKYFILKASLFAWCKIISIVISPSSLFAKLMIPLNIPIFLQ